MSRVVPSVPGADFGGRIEVPSITTNHTGPVTSPSIPTKHEQGTKAEPVDFQLMLELFHAGSAARDVALEMADRNRENARSSK